MDRLVESANSFGSDFLATRVRIHHERIAASDHTNGVAGDRGQRMGHRRDGPDHSERSMLDDCQTVVPAETLRFEELDSRGLFTEGFELRNFVFESSDFGLIHFHRAELNAIVDGDTSDMVDDAAAIGDRAFAELFERGSGCSNCVVDIVE